MIKKPYVPVEGNGIEDETNETLLRVYCRLKPLNSAVGMKRMEYCMSLINNTTLCATPPSLSVYTKQAYYKFKHIFSPESTQKQVFDEVALNLVKRVLNGQNALLFSYGNTGSGKTYTMKGTLLEGGIMPRCLDVIFNSISSKLAKKHLFKSDKFNGFELQSEKEAASDMNRALLKQIGLSKGTKAKMTKKANSDPDLAERFVDPTHIIMVKTQNIFSMFVTFVEIYNNNAYDLLEEYLEDNLHAKAPQAKIIREDSKKNMYVHGVTEVEVSSTEEAYEVFYKGLKKQRVAQTLLNAHSSRSHSIFTIRVVQAELGAHIRHNKGSNSAITVGQLSLVDLAGSERTNRTQNTGKKLKEAGNINNSLMSLRQCFEAVRENLRGGSKIIPYRESKLTTLFKRFFEGDGYISMIICINPHPDDFDENLHVLKFAESTQEIQLHLPLHKQLEAEEANRKQRLFDQFQALDQQMHSILQESERIKLQRQLSLGKLVDIKFPSGDEVLSREYLSIIQRDCDIIEANLNPTSRETDMDLKSSMLRFLCDSTKLSLEHNDLSASLKHEKEKCTALEINHNALKRELDEVQRSGKRLKRELLDKEKAVLQSNAEKDREKEKFLQKKNIYKEKYNSELEKRLRRQRTELEFEIQSKESKLARVQRVLSDEIISSTSSTPSVASCRAKFERIGTPVTVPSTPRLVSSEYRPPVSRKPQVAVSNRRHRRSRSVGDVWVEHKPAMPVPLNTVLQPTMAKRRSITKLTDAKQVTQGASKYCLLTQTQDSDGDLETRLYKADVIPTSGGGAQVLFNDVEVLKQVSPDASPKRAPREEMTDPQASCSYGIEGHAYKLRSKKC